MSYANGCRYVVNPSRNMPPIKAQESLHEYQRMNQWM